jgi:hypothetical protein
MTEFFNEGGWTMLPTALFGFLAVGSSLLIAWKPERRFVPLLLSLGTLTTVAGISGTVMALIGVLKAAAHYSGEDRYTIVLAGTAESLNNAVLAFVFVVVAILAASSGAVRLALRSEPSVHTAR